MVAPQTVKTPKVVLDTNILISALLFENGGLAWVRHAWHGNVFRPLISKATIEELIRVLAYPKFQLSHEERQELLADYLPFCETVFIPQPGPKVPAGRDPSDVPFLELALVGKADALVSGDADLLALKESFPVPIIKPAELIKNTLTSHRT